MRSTVGRLASHSAIYGLADVFTNVVNLLLAPLLTAYLTPADYRVFTILNLFSAFAKILFRLRLDDAFFRTYYDHKTEAERNRLSGTVWLFAAGAGTLLFALVVVFAKPITALLFASPEPSHRLLVLSAADVWISIFGFVPQNLLRIQDRPRLFTALAILRHAVTAFFKAALVVTGFGIPGVLWADIVGSTVFTIALFPILLRHVTWSFEPGMLRQALAFGLPKVPHALLIQVQNLIDRPILDRFVAPADVGVYHMGYTLGSGVKFASSAFEPAWGPFVYSQIGKPDAPQTLARVVTYAFAAFAATSLLVAVFGRELLQVLTFKQPAFWRGAAVIPVVAFAYLLHGVFLLSSIGLGIQKKTSVYPLIALASGAVNVGANLLLIPRHGMMGAAWATVLSYATMAALGAYLSHRVYPLPLEHGRLARLAGGAAACFALSQLAPPGFWGALTWKAASCALYPLVLAASGFLQASERETLRRLASRMSMRHS